MGGKGGRDRAKQLLVMLARGYFEQTAPRLHCGKLSGKQGYSGTAGLCLVGLPWGYLKCDLFLASGPGLTCGLCGAGECFMGICGIFWEKAISTGYLESGHLLRGSLVAECLGGVGECGLVGQLLVVLRGRGGVGRG